MGWLKRWLLKGVKAALLSEIAKLDKFEVELADLMKKKLDPDTTAKLVVDKVQEILTNLVEKNL